MNEISSPLFPEITPFKTEMLPVTEGHTLYLEQCGNPAGIPIIILHGGPGSGSKPKHRQFFDPSLYHMVLFDQRGCGQSTPKGNLKANTTSHLVNDIEAIRTHLGIAQWVVYGNSWGSTLALSYTQAHPQAALGLIVGGIFLGEKNDVLWFSKPTGVAQFAWPQYQKLMALTGNPTPEEFDKRVTAAIAGPEPLAMQVAHAWAMFEGSLMDLEPDVPALAEALSIEPNLKSSALIETHYFSNRLFLTEGQLLANAQRIAHLPAYILQGGLDLVCPPSSAIRLHQVLPNSKLTIVQLSGHRANAAMEAARIEATTAMAKRLRV